ncbi:MAG TPA: SDR family NAD(P)-dependent oxidoreductase [Acidimicrobiales bacterium]|nr:SDR family NAD(P)-dependent oxidoreductase [Acidimicrobiales bacterium]
MAVVTGASRGLGKGVALALGDAGWTVYVTGRSTGRPTEVALGGTLEEAAAEVTGRGGHGVAAPCDHRDDDQVAAVFDRVRAEQGGLDLLVNNAFLLPDSFFSQQPFWERPLSEWDMVDVGLRSHYVAAVFAARLMVPAGKGLIVNTSSFGARYPGISVAYGIGKAGVDRFTREGAADLSPAGVTMASLWPGLMRTERTLANFAANPELLGEGMPLGISESPELSGRVIAAMAADPAVGRFAGKVVVGAELAAEYGITDVDGTQPASLRTVYGGGPVEEG